MEYFCSQYIKDPLSAGIARQSGADLQVLIRKWGGLSRARCGQTCGVWRLRAALESCPTSDSGSPHGYNRIVKRSLVAFVLLSLLGLAGCQKDIQTKDAVRQGILTYLTQNKNLSVNSMDIDVTQVTFRDKEADAVVMFKPKGGDAASGMSMRYTLERQGSTWVVKKKADSGHGATAPGAMRMPSGSMPMPSGSMPMPSAGGAMPAGHPPTGSAAPEPKK